MTQLAERPEPLSAAGSERRPGTFDEVLRRQLTAIGAIGETRRLAETAAAAPGLAREERMDLARRVEVLRRSHGAVVARLDEQLRASGAAPLQVAGPRVILGHRNAWFAGKVEAALRDRVSVVACLENGADLIGVALAEQPELLLLEETLAMVPGEQVVREVRRLCPETFVAAQVADGDRIGPMLDAGATLVLTRQVPPVDVAAELLAHLG